MEPLLTGICLSVAGLLFILRRDNPQRWIGFLLATAGANEVAADKALTGVCVASWLLLTLCLITAFILEETGGRSARRLKK